MAEKKPVFHNYSSKKANANKTGSSTKPGAKKVFTATVTTEKQQNITTRTGTADMRGKATAKPTGKPIIKRISSDPKVKAQLEAKTQKTPKIKITGSASTVSNKKPSIIDSGSRTNKGKESSNKKNSNPIKGAARALVSYEKNAGTQVGQAIRAAGKSLVAGYTPSSKGSKKEAELKAVSANARKQAGQAIGAVLKNKKYKD